MDRACWFPVGLHIQVIQDDFAVYHLKKMLEIKNNHTQNYTLMSIMLFEDFSWNTE